MSKFLLKIFLLAVAIHLSVQGEYLFGENTSIKHCSLAVKSNSEIDCIQCEGNYFLKKGECKKKNLSGGAITGIVLAACVIVGTYIGIIVYCVMKSPSQQNPSQKSYQLQKPLPEEEQIPNQQEEEAKRQQEEEAKRQQEEEAKRQQEEKKKEGGKKKKGKK